MKKHLRTETGIKFAVYVVVVVLVNIVGITLFARFDLTENNMYSLSPASKQAVSELAEPLTVKVFFTENLPAPHNKTRRYLQDLLEEYAVYSNKNFNYRFYNVNPEGQGLAGSSQKNRELAQSYGIRPVQIRSVEQDEIKFKNAYMGLAIIHGDLIEKVPAVTSTEQLEYKLTAAIEKLGNKISALAGLEDKIHARLIMSSTLKDIAPHIGTPKLAELPDIVKKAVTEINRKNYGRLTYEYIDPEKSNTSLNELSQKYDLLNLQWPALKKEGIPAGQGGLGLALAYQGKSRTIQLMDVYKVPMLGNQYELMDMETIKETVEQNIETLIGINQDLGYLADHGTLSIAGQMRSRQNPRQQESLGNIRGLITDTYNIKQINLAENPIPEGLNCMVIARPTESFTDYELYQIDQALMRGTNLAIFSPGLKQAGQSRGRAPGASHVPMDTGLEKLLSNYGVSIEPAYVLDKNCYEQKMPENQGGGNQPIYFAPRIKNKNINHNLDFMKNIKGLITLENSLVNINRQVVEENNLSANRLFSSSDQSWLMKDNIQLNLMMIQPPQAEEKYGKHDLAWLVEGRFPSYFKGKPVPVKKTAESQNQEGKNKSAEKETGKAEEKSLKTEPGRPEIEAKDRFIPRGKHAKILATGSANLLADTLIDSEGRGPNSVFVLNAIDALNGRNEMAALRGKTQQLNPLRETSPAVRSLVRTGNIAGLPVLVIIVGLVAWWRRKQKRIRIRMMFAE
ncbi:MAG: Gldg family protein [Desulfobacteraceae bacterium]|nr:Gldg family protein [Desulfobacteraceae bacterium]